MTIPDIGGVLTMRVPATGHSKTIVCRNLADARDQIVQYKATEVAVRAFELEVIYHPHAFSLEG